MRHQSYVNGNPTVFSTTTTTYDAAGEVLTLTEPNTVTTGPSAGTSTTTYVYNADGEETEETDALGDTTQFTYDAAGRQTSETTAARQTTQMIYDADGRLIKTIYPDETFSTTTYNVARAESDRDRPGRPDHELQLRCLRSLVLGRGAGGPEPRNGANGPADHSLRLRPLRQHDVGHGCPEPRDDLHVQPIRAAKKRKRGRNRSYPRPNWNRPRSCRRAWGRLPGPSRGCRAGPFTST